MSDGTPVVPHLNDDVTTSLQWGHTVWNWKCRSGVKVNLSAWLLSPAGRSDTAAASGEGEEAPFRWIARSRHPQTRDLPVPEQQKLQEERGRVTLAAGGGKTTPGAGRRRWPGQLAAHAFSPGNSAHAHGAVGGRGRPRAGRPGGFGSGDPGQKPC
jgi:hypothetical protein